jgi:hypothetical protein
MFRDEDIARMKLVTPLCVLFLGIVANSTLSYAKPEYTKKEKRACTFCHVSGNSKELNDAGKYYKEHDHSLEGYKPAQ